MDGCCVTSVPNAVHQGRQLERGGKACKEEEGAVEKKVCEKMCLFINEAREKEQDQARTITSTGNKKRTR
jgi:hypothetical protein